MLQVSYSVSNQRCLPFFSLFSPVCQYINYTMASHAAYTQVPIESSVTSSHSIHSSTNSEVEKNQPRFSTSTWRIGWRTPTLIIASYLLGMAPSTHQLYQYSLTDTSHNRGIYQLLFFPVPRWEIRRRAKSNYTPIICLDLF